MNFFIITDWQPMNIQILAMYPFYKQIFQPLYKIIIEKLIGKKRTNLNKDNNWSSVNTFQLNVFCNLLMIKLNSINPVFFFSTECPLRKLV